MILYRLIAAACVLASLWVDTHHQRVVVLLLAVVAALFAVVEAARPDEPWLRRTWRRSLDEARREQNGDEHRERTIWPT